MHKVCSFSFFSNTYHVVIELCFLNDFRSFNKSNHFTQASEGPIKESTILTMDPATGKVTHKAGKNK